MTQSHKALLISALQQLMLQDHGRLNRLVNNVMCPFMLQLSLVLAVPT